MKFTINGKFLCEPMTGMQRYAYEILRELDFLCETGEFELVVPKKAREIPPYRNIAVTRYGHLSGIPWEQINLPLYLIGKKTHCVNLLNVVPLLRPRDTVVVHDVGYKVNPQFFLTPRDRLSRLWHVLNFRMSFTFADTIITVSEFSKSEMIKAYHIKEDKVFLAPNAWQHMERIETSADLFDRYPFLKKGRYYFSMSSVGANKNFLWIARVAANNPQERFAIAGGRSLQQYLDTVGVKKPDNLFFLGYVSDSDAKALMTHCRAFLFPTFYEGFGIPPMEAMSCGAATVVSDTPTMREIYGDAVHYIDPYDYSVDLDALTRQPVAPPETVLNRFSWRKSAEAFYRILKARTR